MVLNYLMYVLGTITIKWKELSINQLSLDTAPFHFADITSWDLIQDLCVIVIVILELYVIFALQEEEGTPNYLLRGCDTTSMTSSSPHKKVQFHVGKNTY